MRKVCVVITARPSYSRFRSALEALKAHDDIELQVVAAASALLDRYGSVVDEIERDGFEIASKVYMVLEGEQPSMMAKTTGIGMIELATALDNLRPDFVVTIADRHETLATAVAAAYMNIPLVHIQGGEITGSIDEKVRHAITKLADYHLVSTERARGRVIRMGEDPETVVVTGCPSIDIAATVLEAPALDFDPMQKYGGVGAEIDLSKGYLVVLQHPVTTEHELARQHVQETLSAAAGSGIPTLWFWPNPDAGSDGTSRGIRAFRESHNPSNLHFFKNMAPTDFLRVLYHSSCLVGNSSAGIRECSFLGVPAVNIGGRQAGRDRGANAVDVDYDRAAIADAIRRQTTHGRYPSDTLYGDGAAGPRIAAALSRIEPRIHKRLNY
ncbi:MAG: UDP-N-acetylglucosamine 2-epimerase [Myxococcales bacterium]|nr:UDP-N-acetylglucosamine 2-epimerase [Myxococcales bacterium]